MSRLNSFLFFFSSREIALASPYYEVVEKEKLEVSLSLIGLLSDIVETVLPICSYFVYRVSYDGKKHSTAYVDSSVSYHVIFLHFE